MSDVELIKVCPNLTDETYELIEALWSSYKSEYCHNYKSLSNAMDSQPSNDKIKELMEPFKKLGFVKAYRGLRTEDGKVAGSGFAITSNEAFLLLELAMYRHNFYDNPLGRSEDYMPKTLEVAGHVYKLAVPKP